MLPTQKPKKVWQAGAAPAQAQAAEDWEEELDRELKFFTDGMDDKVESSSELDVKGHDTLENGVHARILEVNIPTSVTDFNDIHNLAGLPNSKKYIDQLAKDIKAAKKELDEKKVPFRKFLIDNNLIKSKDELTDDLIITLLTGVDASLSAEVLKKAKDYRYKLFYYEALQFLQSLVEKTKTLFKKCNFESSALDITSTDFKKYVLCAKEYFKIQTYFVKIDKDITAVSNTDIEYGTLLNLIEQEKWPAKETHFNQVLAAPLPDSSATDPSAAPQPAPPDPSAAPQPAPPDPSAAPQPAPPDPSAQAPASQTAQPTVPQDPIPPSGADKRGTKDKYFANDFDFLPDLQLYISFDNSKEINPGSPEAILHATKWKTYYYNSYSKFRIDLDNYEPTGSADADFEEKKKILEGNLWICKLFQDIWEAVLNIQRTIEPFYNKFQKIKFRDDSFASHNYNRLYESSQSILNFFLDVESKVQVELRKPKPVLTQSNLFGEDRKKQVKAYSKIFSDVLESLSPSKSSDQSKQQPDTSQSKSRSEDSQSQSKSSKKQDDSSKTKPKTQFSSRSASMSDDIKVLQKQLRQTIEWGLEMRAAAQENYRIAQKVREFFGPGYEFDDPNKKAPDYDDPPNE